MLKSVYYGIVPRALTKTNIRGPSWRNRVTTVGVVYTGHFRRGASATSRVIARAGPTRLPSHAFREHVRLWLAFILSSKLLTHDSANVIAHYSSLLNFYALYNAFSCLRIAISCGLKVVFCRSTTYVSRLSWVCITTWGLDDIFNATYYI